MATPVRRHRRRDGNGKIYVIGGATMMPGSSETSIHPARRHMVVGAVEEYDPATNTWRARAASCRRRATITRSRRRADASG